MSKQKKHMSTDQGLTLGQQIKMLRQKSGLTQIELAAGLCTPSMISQIESDRAKPSFKVLGKLAERLDTPMSRLLQGVDLNLELHAKYKMAKAMYQAKEYEVAITLFQELLEEPSPIFSTFEMNIDLGTCYMATGNLKRADKVFSDAIDTAKLYKEPDVQARLFMLYSILCKKKRKYQLAVYYAEKANVEAQDVQDTTLLGWLFTECAALFREIGNIEEALRFFAKLEALPDDWSSLEGRSKVFLELAKIYQQKEDYERCGYYASKAQSLLEQVEAETQYKELQKEVLLLNPVDVWEQTVEGLLEFALHFESNSDLERAGQTYVEIASLYLDHGEGAPALTKAQEYADKARSLIPDTHPVNGGPAFLRKLVKPLGVPYEMLLSACGYILQTEDDLILSGSVLVMLREALGDSVEEFARRVEMLGHEVEHLERNGVSYNTLGMIFGTLFKRQRGLTSGQKEVIFRLEETFPLVQSMKTKKFELSLHTVVSLVEEEDTC